MCNNIKALRLKAGLTQKELAEKSGLTQTAISKYEADIASIENMNLKTAEKLSQVFNCTIEKLTEKMEDKKMYKDFSKKFIGESDIAKLVMFGCTDEGAKPEVLCFGEDGDYSAYIVDDMSCEIPEHYEKVAEFSSWLKIYDDNGLTLDLNAKKIEVFRSGSFGCIIKIEK